MAHRIGSFAPRRALALLVLSGSLLGAGATARAQQADSARADSTAGVVQQGSAKTLIRPAPRLFSRRDALVAGAFMVGTAAMMPIDRQVASQLQKPDVQANRLFGDLSARAEGIATPGAYLIGGALLVVGRVGGQLSSAQGFDRMADLGWHGLEAVMLSEGVGYVLKGAIGRSRPYVSGANDPQQWKLGGGFGTTDQRSFPSGHTYTAFAAASVVTSELRRWWPRSTWVVAPAMYGGATLVGLSRMYHNKHWASDVVMGAAIGTFTGLKVVQHSHDGSSNLLDRIVLGSTVMPTRGGMALGWKATTPF